MSKNSATGLLVTEKGLVVPIVKPELAYTQGTSVKRLQGESPMHLYGWMLYEIIRTCKYLECKNTIRDKEDARELADELIERYPTMKVEEFAICFKNIRMQVYGKYYERLKAGEFLECFLKFDSNEQRIRMLEEINTAGKKELSEPLDGVDYDKMTYRAEKGVYQRPKFTDLNEVERSRRMAEQVLKGEG